MPSDLPWPEQIRALYLSGAANQFVLHGNVDDRLLLEVEEGEEPALGNLIDFLTQHQLRRFDLIFTYNLGHGLQVETLSKAGKKAFENWPSARNAEAFPKTPRDGIAYMDHFLRYCCNLRSLGLSADAKGGESKDKGLSGRNLSVALIIRDASLVMPAQTGGYEVHSMASLVRSWSTESHFKEQNLATFLITEKLHELHPLVVGNPRLAQIEVPLPSTDELQKALVVLAKGFPVAMQNYEGREDVPAARLAGATLSSVEALIKGRHFAKEPLDDLALSDLKKRLVEKDCQGLIEFIESDRSLEQVHGNQAVTTWLRQDIALWNQGDLQAMPMGYLLCGPVGTGKTFLVECLAGEAGVPVVRMKNFRDRWVGSTEGNLEKIFTLLHALGRCIVFIDEADQALGSRSAASGDSGVSSRVYSMMAAEMSDTRNRGKILWILASSRPDLIEVDLKRPGRIDVKIPLFPCVDPEEVYGLIRALCHRKDLALPEVAKPDWRLPQSLTPGAAEAIAVKVYRRVRTQEKLEPAEALSQVLSDYVDPIPAEVMDFQSALAVREASDLNFVPDPYRSLVVDKGPDAGA